MAKTHQLYREDRCRVLGVDSSSMGEPIVKRYREMGLNVNGITFTLNSKDDMMTNLRSLLQGAKSGVAPYLVMPRSGNLVDELKAQLKEQERLLGASERPHYSHPQGRHDDLLWALAIACYVGRDWLTSHHFVVRLY
jgi:hypothetical protein